jgi:glucosamine--fructose-6-phosphate aminotransferase (isomerizing)
LNGLIDRARVDQLRFAEHPGARILEKARELTLVACGTSWHAALVGKYWIERWARIPVNVELASEFRYRDYVLREGAVVMGITQSGETADTLAVIRDAKKRGIPTVAITNVRGSTISREADATFFTCAGPEIGVAATKTYLAQMLALLVVGGCLNQRPELPTPLDGIIRLPHLVAELLQPSSPMLHAIEQAARELVSAKGFFFIGRGYSFPIALEGALKLKEIAYVHAEGYAAGELKHGPIAMIDPEMVVVVLAPKDEWREKTVSNLEEVKARGAKILGIGDPSDHALQELCDHWVPVSVVPSDTTLLPFVLTPAIQLLSYKLAVLKGTDVDKPRNLAKSVTVE